jgi:hypothetical protein
MKFSLRNSAGTKISWCIACVALLFFLNGCRKGDHAPRLKVTTVASGLAFPLGIETDYRGNIWVTESETINNDGKVVVIKPNGKKYDAIINLSAFVNENSGQPQGTSHILLDGGTLYILSGNYLYKADVSHFKPGDQPIDAATLSHEDFAPFVYGYPFVNDANDSHPYNMTKGPDGDLYITDAGANAIIHRTAPGVYSILAEVPGIMNPTPVGPPNIQAVPTSIMYDGHDFLVTTLLGFPFPSGSALIYKISKSGNVSIYQDGFTMLVDQAEGNFAGHIVVQHASSFNPATGFAPNTGSLLLVNGSTSEEIAGGLNTPAGIKQANSNTWYVTCLGDGTVIKVSY